jgi:hypothetical protein
MSISLISLSSVTVRLEYRMEFIIACMIPVKLFEKLMITSKKIHD